jgi:hypothetical protein
MRSSGSTRCASFAVLLATAAAPLLLRAQAPVPPPVPDAAAPAALGTIRDVRRQVLPEAVRITVELDREVPFYQEELGTPSRVFLDLKATQTTSKLVDADLKYDSDVVREVRLGRHAGNTTRIVVDLQGVTRYSVYTLYSPFRIVVDCERVSDMRAKPPAPPVTAPATPAAASPAPAAPAANRGGEFSVARQLGLGV